MTNKDEIVSRWLDAGPEHGPSAPLEDAFARAAITRQRPRWIVGLTGGAFAARPSPRRLQLGFAAIAVVVVAVGGGLFMAGKSGPVPPASSTPGASSSPASSETTTGDASVKIIFTEAGWVAISNVDGTQKRRLFPDGPPGQTLVAVSADGRRVLVEGIVAGDPSPSDDYYLTDLAGTTPTRLSSICVNSCQLSSVGNFAFSPDGTRLAFLQDGIAILNLDTGEVADLPSTVAPSADGAPACKVGCRDGENGSPRWSPDGKSLVFARTRIGIAPGNALEVGATKVSKLFTVDVDGSNFRQLLGTDMYGREAQWSPDGSRIVFESLVEKLTINSFGKLENSHRVRDIYAVRPDGSDLIRITTFPDPMAAEEAGEAGPFLPSWTRDGRVVFLQQAAGRADALGLEVWTADGDGRNLTAVGVANATTLASAGCVDCPYPIRSGTFGYWRTMP